MIPFWPRLMFALAIMSPFIFVAVFCGALAIGWHYAFRDFMAQHPPIVCRLNVEHRVVCAKP